MRRSRSLLVSFVLLEGFWALLVGTRQPTELGAGLIAAAAGAVFAEVCRSLGLLPPAPPRRMVVQAWRLVWQVPFDFAVIAWVLVRALARGRRVRGTWVTQPFGDDGRAFAAVVGTTTPNAIVVDIDGGEALLHGLETGVSTGRSVL